LFKTLYAWSLFLVLFCAVVPSARAQFTVYDPTNYFESVANYGELVQSNGTLLQQYQQDVQQYNMFQSQFRNLNSMSAYSGQNLNRWSTTFNQINGGTSNQVTGTWGTSLNTGGGTTGYAAANSAIMTPTPLALTYNNTSTSSNIIAQNNNTLNRVAIGDALNTAGAVRASAINNDAALQQLQTDTLTDDSDEDAQLAIEQKTSIALLIIAQAQSDTNKLLAAQLELATTQAQAATNQANMHAQVASDLSTTSATVDQSFSGSNTGGLSTSYSTMTTTLLNSSNGTATTIP
jgi:hypothetical protein